jgi:predicted permease
MLKTLRHEMREAVRRLLAKPLYALLALSILSLGLGNYLFMFSAVDSIVLRPLPFPQPDRLVHFAYAQAEDPDDVQYAPGIELQEFMRDGQAFEAAGAYAQVTVTLRDATVPVARYDGTQLTAGLFNVFGVAPLLGRTLHAQDDQPGAPLNVVIGERLWREAFAADPNIIGRAVFANAESATVVGVMPESFRFPTLQQIWLPARVGTQWYNDMYWGEALARLKPGVTVAQVEARWRARFAQTKQQRPAELAGLTTIAQPAAYRFAEQETRQTMGLMLISGLLVLFLTCANVANLQLTQTIARQRELAVRAALGASRWRLAANALVESLILATLATALGLFLAQVGGEGVNRMLTAANEAPPYWMTERRFSAALIAMVFAVALLSTVLAGLIPALRASRTALTAHLQDHGRAGSGGFARLSRWLVVGEIALSCVLLVGAGIVIRGLQEYRRADLGTHTDPRQILTARIPLFAQQYPDAAAQLRFFEGLLERVRREPDVIAASMASTVPGDRAGRSVLRVEGVADRPETNPPVYSGAVDPAFQDVYGVRLIEGRWFNADDTVDTPLVGVIDRRVAERLFEGRSAIGRRMLVQNDGGASAWHTVIGVVEPLHLEDTDDPRLPAVLGAAAQHIEPFMNIAVHVRGDPMAFAPRLAQLTREANPDTPVYWVNTHQRVLEMSYVGADLLARIFGVAGLIGLLLAAAGLYGVLAFSVAQRTREIGLRRAVGARAGHVVREVALRGAHQVAWGLGIGLVLGLPWALLLGRVWDRAELADPTLFLVVSAVIVLAAMLAVWVPVRRALAVDPMVALRYE